MSQLVQGSVADVAKRSNKTLAEAFLEVDAVVIVDTSASMELIDVLKSEVRVSRYSEACNQLSNLQSSMPGKIAVIAFSSYPIYCPDGHAKLLSGSTNLLGALQMVEPADGSGLRFIVISDGEPDTEEPCIDLARKMETRIDTIYIGPPEGRGRDFLKRLAQAGKGQSATKPNEILQLQETVRELLTA